MKSLKDIRENQAKKIANKALTKPLKIFCLQTMTDTELYYVQNIIVNTQLLLLLFFEHFEKNIIAEDNNLPTQTINIINIQNKIKVIHIFIYSYIYVRKEHSIQSLCTYIEQNVYSLLSNVVMSLENSSTTSYMDNPMNNPRNPPTETSKSSKVNNSLCSFPLL